MIRTIVPIDISVSKFFGGQSPHKNKILGGTKVPPAVQRKKRLKGNIDLAVDRASRTALVGLSVGFCDQPALRRSDDSAAGRLGPRTG
jgi:hypothetical protein